MAATYLYSFRRPSSLDDVGRRRTDVAHGGVDDDLAYAFGAPLVAAGSASRSATSSKIDPFTDSFTRYDRQLSQVVMNYWINFIRYGCVVVICHSTDIVVHSLLSTVSKRTNYTREKAERAEGESCLLYTSPSPRDS